MHADTLLCFVIAVYVKLLSTAEEVSKLQEDLELMQPELEEAVRESVVTMQQIAEDTVRDYIYIYSFV